MKFKGTIIITDPCYVIKDKNNEQDDWRKCEYGECMEDLGISHYISKSTIYGDWGCTTWKTPRKDVKTQMKELREGDTKSAKDLSNIGEFCADAGLVAVFLLDEVLKYNPDFSKWMKEHPWCVTTIPDFDGEVEYYVDENLHAHIIGVGNINFFTTQTSL